MHDTNSQKLKVEHFLGGDGQKCFKNEQIEQTELLRSVTNSGKPKIPSVMLRWSKIDMAV